MWDDESIYSCSSLRCTTAMSRSSEQREGILYISSLHAQTVQSREHTHSYLNHLIHTSSKETINHGQRRQDVPY